LPVYASYGMAGLLLCFCSAGLLLWWWQHTICMCDCAACVVLLSVSGQIGILCLPGTASL
jgi:fructose-1,6-bisphosphatase/inositol monophosphatase family enzyme